MLQLRRATINDTEELVQLALLAWAPVFASLRETLSPGVYGLLYSDWRQQQRDVVERCCNAAERTTVWIAEIDGMVAGFVACTIVGGEQIGTVGLLAVHPEYQRRCIATALNRLALDQMKASRLKLAGLSTGGDPGHVPARRAYEKTDYLPFPNVWYYQGL